MSENFKRLRHAGPGRTTDAELDELIAQDWYPVFTYLGYFSFWLRRGGGGNVDLTEILNRLEGLDTAIDVIGQTHDQIWKAIDELKQGGNGLIPTYSFEFDVWCAPDIEGAAVIAKPGMIKSQYGFVDGGEMCARFTIKEGTAVSDGIFYIVPEQAAQPTGYGPFFPGKAAQHCEKHGWMLDGVAHWHGRSEFGGGKRGIRLQLPNFNPVMSYVSYRDHEYIRPGGALFAGKHGGDDAMAAHGGNTYEVGIRCP